MGELVAHALGYAGLDLQIFPVHPETKRPLHTQLDATTNLDQIEAWWGRWPNALIGHRIAPDIVLLDIDPRHGGLATWQAIKADPRFNGAQPRAHLSGRGDGGGHTWWKRPAERMTVTKLDAWAEERGLGQRLKGRWTSGIDVLRHEHRYTILPPSPHPDTGKPYRWARGRGLNANPAEMPRFLAELLTRDDAPAPTPQGPQWRDPDSIADWFSDSHSWRDVLEPHGWTCVAGDGDSDGSEWRHPRATNEVSATIRHECLFVYSTSTPFEPTEPDDPHGYTRFAAWAVLEHAGDQKAAGRAARKLKDGSGGNARLTLERLKPPSEGSDTREAEKDAEKRPERQIVLTPLSAIKPRRVRWCWEGRLALGTLGLLAGPEGLGKSTVAATIGAKTTRGRLRGEYHGTPKAVLVAATEDSFEHTIRPRFEAAGADLDRVYRIEVETDDDLIVPLSLPDDLGKLERVAFQIEPALLILDPLISRLSRELDSHKDGEVRSALEPLVSIANRTGMSILGLIHHNKSGKADPLDLIMASKAFTAVARSVHTVIRDPDDETNARRYFGTPKNNLGRLDLPSKAFTIEPYLYETDDGPSSTGRVVWQEDSDESITDLIGRITSEPGKNTKLSEAMDWLEEYMAGHGPRVETNTVKAAGRAAGHSARTLDRAADKLKIEKKKGDFTGGWFWIAPEGRLPPGSIIAPGSITEDDL